MASYNLVYVELVYKFDVHSIKYIPDMTSYNYVKFYD
jgi:hypothetical protein